ncbi:peptidase inhibitor 16-like isoform X2 [Hypanus sabinus]|uniref:peptidase inhibitor 16-like isoform X2 n=1 Tax=Hypanus sabinus TaxID=79690 RepID=UPI0028C3A511|nr:peptidase inhibitor 16-like isoform X2 [Hypanus sabinus]
MTPTLQVLLLFIALELPQTAPALTSAEKKAVLNAHNEFRSKVPDAANMLKMRWDRQLEKIAQKYAKKCVWKHNPNRGRIGENLYATSGQLNPVKGVEDWYREVKDYTYDTMACTPKKMCGHYTQVVWATSDKVGCGAHLCDKLQGLNGNKLTILVCNYAPPGNYIGSKPYKKGTHCSACPPEYKCIDNLCTSKAGTAASTQHIGTELSQNPEAQEHQKTHEPIGTAPLCYNFKSTLAILVISHFA